MQIAYSALDKQHEKIKLDILKAVEHVLDTGVFILGNQVEEFEKKFSAYHGKKYAIGLNSGTDALMLSLKALGIGAGDEVITTANSFITSVSSIVLVGAKPVLVDIGYDDNLDVEQIERAITDKTTAILPVHWTGRPCNMARISQIAEKYGLKIIEDCAQAISARFKNKLVGTFGDAGCFSLHPFKTLNACGDGGVVVTDNLELAERIKVLRHNGLSMDGSCHFWSNNSRLDSIQASILNIKLDHFEDWTQRRIQVAAYYDVCLKSIKEITLPAPLDSDYYSVYHTYIIKAQSRDDLQAYLFSKGIETKIHYKIPIHQQQIAKQHLGYVEGDLRNIERIAKEVLSLPIYPELARDEQDYVVEQIKNFYSNR
ncbi:MAG: DegT/DnrJ/EryC1/StrS family aminotransferase [Methylococcales bacterium]|nr:DegT/DnrJ/EryC1/StrS family aminotransferase [Methylococcales bacterium]